MTGLAVAGYGAGALVMGPLAAFGMAIAGVPATFAALGLMYLAVIVLAGRFHVDPPQAIPALSRAAAVARGREYGVAEAVRTPRFWMLWTLLFVNVSAGIMVLSQVSPMAQEIAGLSPFAATGMIGLISLANAAGRVFWAWVSDAIGRAEVFALLFAIQAVTFVVLPALRDPALFGTALALVGLCFGGGFGTMPSFTADVFGATHMGGIYGWMLLAWSCAAIPSPLFIAHVRQATGHHDPALYLLAGVLLCATLIPLLARRPAAERAAALPSTTR